MAIRSKEQAANALREEHHNSFKTQNLEHIVSLKHLADVLKDMRDDVYNYHVGDGYNHFADWIRDVFGDTKLAHDIFDKERKKAAQAIKKRIKWLEKKVK